MKNIKIKKDRFRQSRGGGSKLLKVVCTQCSDFVLVYQKDGKGNLFRLYLDRIHHPDSLVKIVSSWNTISQMDNLHCNNCKNLLAVPMVYEPEKRLALRIIQGTIHLSKYKE